MRAHTAAIEINTSADRKLLTNAIILIALGLSILFLNSWDNLVVRTTVALFWGTFLLILNVPEAVRTIRRLKTNYDTARRTGLAKTE